MIYQKRGMWKSSHSSKKFYSEEEALKWENVNVLKVEPIKAEEVLQESELSPLEQLRGWKEPEVELCNECDCEPCECEEEEWNSVEEISSETESSMEEIS